MGCLAGGVTSEKFTGTTSFGEGSGESNPDFTVLYRACCRYTTTCRLGQFTPRASEATRSGSVFKLTHYPAAASESARRIDP